MLKKLVFTFSLLATLVACNNSQEDKNNAKEDLSIEGLKASIQEMDDTLMMLMKESVKTSSYEIEVKPYYEAINRNKDFYFNYPNDPYAETALSKIAALYLQINVEGESVQWRDTLLAKFPNTKDKIGLLELQMSYYDYNDYTPEKIRYYANQLLAIENLPEEKREQYEFRLKHIDKTFEELIEFQMVNESDAIEKEETQ